MNNYIKQYAPQCFIALVLVGIFCVSFKPMLFMMVEAGKYLERILG